MWKPARSDCVTEDRRESESVVRCRLVSARVGRPAARCLALFLGTAAVLLSASGAAGAASYVYVTNLFGHNVSQFAAGSGGLLAPLIPPTVPTGQYPLGVTVSPDGRSVYVADSNDSFPGPATISQYDLGANGTLTPKARPTVLAGTTPSSVALTPDGKSAYVSNVDSPTANGTVSQYSVGADGTLTPKSPAEVAAPPNPQLVVVAPDGKSAYVPEFAFGRVYQFDITANGTLAPKTPPTVPAGSNPQGAAVAPDGSSLYVSNASGNSVSQYDIGPGGALSPKSPPTVPAGDFAASVVASPDGTSIYVANAGGGSVSQYDVGAGGTLSPKTPATVAAGAFPVGAAISADGSSLYVANEGGDNLSQYDVGAGGLLSAKTPATVSTGSFPFGVAVTPGPCAGVRAEPGKLFPGNRSFGTVSLVGASGALQFHINGVSQDEPVTATGDVTKPDARLTAAGADSNTLQLRAEYNPRRDGRVYRIAYTLTEGNTVVCSKNAADTNAKVSVPRTPGGTAVDNAPPSYNSFTGTQLP
jgi:DNA-binding beta-propeller fold protein YncE